MRIIRNLLIQVGETTMRLFITVFCLLALTGCTAFLIGGATSKSGPTATAEQNCQKDQPCDDGQ